jgi:hypothetical protein
VIEYLAAGRVKGELLQRQGSPGNGVSEGLSGFVIATLKAHRVVRGEPGVSPAQESLCELLREEAQRKVEADGASAQALGQGSGVVDGQVGEPPGGVESALKDEGVEMGIEPKRVPEGLTSDNGGAVAP